MFLVALNNCSWFKLWAFVVKKHKSTCRAESCLWEKSSYIEAEKKRGKNHTLVLIHKKSVFNEIVFNKASDTAIFSQFYGKCLMHSYLTFYKGFRTYYKV